MVSLGQRVRDRITGFKGIVVARSQFMYGCVRIGVEGKSKVGEIMWFDEQRLEIKSSAVTGGPRSAPSSRDAKR